MNTATGNFGNLADDYERGRKDYPPHLMAVVERYVGKTARMVLDIGCGSGKATRLLAMEERFVIGVDADVKFIQKAQESGGFNLAYRLASAESLPFNDAMFDAVTTFGSFHWWYRIPGAVDSVFRVLREMGHFIIVNKDDAGSFRQEMRDVVRMFSEHELLDAKLEYNPEQFLRADTSLHVEAHQLPHREVFTLPELISQIRSMSSWNAIPEARLDEATRAMEAHFSPQLKEGVFTRSLLVRVVAARKKDAHELTATVQCDICGRYAGSGHFDGESCRAPNSGSSGDKWCKGTLRLIVE